MMDPQLDTAVHEPNIFEQVAAMSKPPIVKLDRSRDNIASVHGEIPKSDPLSLVFFFQDALPYNAQGILLWDHPIVQNDPVLLKKAAKLLRRALKQKLQDPEPEEVEADDNELDEDDDEEQPEEDFGPPKVNFKAWAAGLQDVQWQEVSNAIARKFAKRVKNKHDALELLIEMGEVSAGALSRGNRKLLETE